jgi:uncharacterized protein YjlB
MPIVEDAKALLEKITGLGRPDKKTVRSLIRQRKAGCLFFDDDGQTPNNSKLPLIIYRSPIDLAREFDPAAIFEVLFARNGWTGSWRDGVYRFLHFHTRTHEVLGIARGRVRVQFGGKRGRLVELKAGDVAVLPAGTGHQRKSATRDLLVVGAYPKGGKYDEPAPRDIAHDHAVRAIGAVPQPRNDPVYGRNGPLMHQWKRRKPARPR